MAFSWGNPLNVLRSYRHLTAYIWDTTNQKRAQWAARQAERYGSDEFSFQRDLPDEFSFIVVGDTGEGDSSQMVVVDKFLKEGADTEFSVIASDVIYPAGRSYEYREKFYVPYRHYKKDIYAVPGNHDWYDELVGFMVHFCDNTHHYEDTQSRTVNEEKLKMLRAIRHNQYYQPNMYFYMDTRYVRLVFIDTGIKGEIGESQREWLQKVSDDSKAKPKILISGKPIFANGKFDEKLRDVNDIVNRYNYRLVIGGDTHNYQKYRIPIPANGGQKYCWHLVSGGGGAYLSRTHKIPLAKNMEFPGDLNVRFQDEPDDFECYPTRENSKKFFGSEFNNYVPDSFADHDLPPYYKNFIKVCIEKTGIRVQVFGIEHFDTDIDAKPMSEWEIPY
jgi:Calcineurin-like phosphoesterase